MEKAKYTFNHFIIQDGERKQIDPNKVGVITDQCKLLWTNMSTGKDHIIISKVAQ